MTDDKHENNNSCICCVLIINIMKIMIMCKKKLLWNIQIEYYVTAKRHVIYLMFS